MDSRYKTAVDAYLEQPNASPRSFASDTLLGCSDGWRYWLWTPLLALAMSCGVVNAQISEQSSAPAAPSPVSEAGTRADLLESLRRIDAQLTELTDSAQPEEAERLLELKAQFEVLVLQAELEALRRENAALQTQRVQAGSEAPQGDGASPLEDEMSAMRRQFARLGEQQANVTAQLGTIEQQHALLLEELGSATSDAAPSATSADVQNPELQTQLTELRSRFAQLDTQQEEVNTQLKTITDQHAALLDQLGTADQSAPAPSPSTSRTYVVRPGDSLSELAKAFYGVGARWPELLQANPSLTDPDQLLAGMVLVIP